MRLYSLLLILNPDALIAKHDELPDNIPHGLRKAIAFARARGVRVVLAPARPLCGQRGAIHIHPTLVAAGSGGG